LNKRIIFLITCTLFAALLFSTALICNMCGLPLKIGAEDTNTANEPYQPDNKENNRYDAGSDFEGQSPENKEQPSNNSSPVIEKLEIEGINIKLAESAGYFRDLPSSEMQGSTVIIDIFVSDKDGDALSYLSYDSLGNNFEVKKIDNGYAELIWMVPAHSGSYNLTLEVSDVKGGMDSYTAEMNFN
jgi:hypothetical protein